MRKYFSVQDGIVFPHFEHIFGAAHGYLLHLPQPGDRAAPVLGVAPHGEAESHGEDDEAEGGARKTCNGGERVNKTFSIKDGMIR